MQWLCDNNGTCQQIKEMVAYQAKDGNSWTLSNQPNRREGLSLCYHHAQPTRRAVLACLCEFTQSLCQPQVAIMVWTLLFTLRSCLKSTAFIKICLEDACTYSFFRRKVFSHFSLILQFAWIKLFSIYSQRLTLILIRCYTICALRYICVYSICRLLQNRFWVGSRELPFYCRQPCIFLASTSSKFAYQ